MFFVVLRSAGVTGLFSQTSRGPSTAPPAPTSQTQFSFEGSALAGGGGGLSGCVLPAPPLGPASGGHQRGAQQMRSTTSSSSSSSTGATTTLYNSSNNANPAAAATVSGSHSHSSLSSNRNSTSGLVDPLARVNLQDLPVAEVQATPRPHSGGRDYSTVSLRTGFLIDSV